jgi:nucleotide-binding universal stress UspA family protein
MKWIVATNLREDSRGALEWTAWLHRHVRAPGLHPTAALAVVREAGGFVSTPDAHALVQARVKDAAATFIANSPARDAIEAIRVEVAADVASALCEAVSVPGATLVMGRPAPRENRRLVRLGRVARRTLRQLAGPVVVVPPDWTVALAGQGPIVVAVDASDSSLKAIEFAEDLAGAVGRPLLAVQAIQGVSALSSAFLTPAEFTHSRERHRQQETSELARFLESRGHASLAVRSEVGPTLHTLFDVADDVKAAAIVCGSRRLGLAERILSASVGSELAAFAELPVAVVPPDYASG